MSKETALHLNTNVLVGMTSERGTAWHYDAALQGDESNHYEGAIPVGDVKRRLFDWKAVEAPLFGQLPTSIENMDTIDANGVPVRNIPIPDRKVIMRDDTGAAFGVFTQGYKIHQFDEWLIGNVSNLLQDTLVISSAGLLEGGAIAWVEISIPETIHDQRTGFTYRPNLLATTSHNGKIATTYGRTVTATVCDNTMSIARSEMGEQKAKVRHSSQSLSEAKRGEFTRALSLVQSTADEFDAQLQELSSRTVTQSQLDKFLTLWNPIPEDKGAARTKAMNKRDELVNLYRNDARVAPWAGTDFGVLQMANTHLHHLAEVRGVDRSERNRMRAAKHEVEAFDQGVLDALALAKA